MNYTPPFTITAPIVSLIAEIGQALGRLSAQQDSAELLRLRRINRIRTIRGSLAIEGNTLNEEQITAILEGKRVVAPPREILEVRNALTAYDRLVQWRPEVEADLLAAHGILMAGLIDEAGGYRRGGVGVMAGERVIHLAPQAERVPLLMGDLFRWLAASDQHPLITGSVFHYEFEFIHPFADGNGRLGRLWQTLILTRWNPLFADIPVESMVHEHQQEYYDALGACTQLGESSPFIEFMLGMIRDTLVRAQSRAQKRAQSDLVLAALTQSSLSANELIALLNLRGKTGAFKRTLRELLDQGCIEYTLPDTPNSRLQRYRLTEKGRTRR